MVKVFKEKDYKATHQGQTPEDLLISGLEGLRSDFGSIVDTVKKFPIRSTPIVIGFIAVLYIRFKVRNKFVKI